MRDLSLVSEVEVYHCLLLASSDISTSGRTSREMLYASFGILLAGLLGILLWASSRWLRG